MKTTNFIKNIIRLSLVLVAASTLAACSKDKDKNNNNYGYNNYYMQNGQCYSRSNSQPVNPQYCYNNNNCYQTQQYGYQQYGQQYQQYGNPYTQQYPNNQYCQPGGNGGMITQPCYGQFTDPRNGQPGWCNGQNCAGFMLYNQYGQAVQCI